MSLSLILVEQQSHSLSMVREGAEGVEFSVQTGLGMGPGVGRGLLQSSDS